MKEKAIKCLFHNTGDRIAGGKRPSGTSRFKNFIYKTRAKTYIVAGLFSVIGMTVFYAPALRPTAQPKETVQYYPVPKPPPLARLAPRLAPLNEKITDANQAVPVEKPTSMKVDAAVETALKETKKELLALKKKAVFKGVHFNERTLDEAADAFKTARKDGIVEEIHNVANQLPEVDTATLLTLAFHESRFKHDISASNSSATGIVQITDGTFLTWVGCYGPKAHSRLENANPSAARTLEKLLPFVAYDAQTGKTLLLQKEYRAAFGKKNSLKKSLLALRKSPAISLMLTGLAREEEGPELKKACAHARPEYRDFYTKGGLDLYFSHIYGIGGAQAIIKHKNTNTKMEEIVGSNAADNNKDAGKTLDKAVKEYALKDEVLKTFFRNTMTRLADNNAPGLN